MQDLASGLPSPMSVVRGAAFQIKSICHFYCCVCSSRTLLSLHLSLTLFLYVSVLFFSLSLAIQIFMSISLYFTLSCLLLQCSLKRKFKRLTFFRYVFVLRFGIFFSCTFTIMLLPLIYAQTFGGNPSGVLSHLLLLLSLIRLKC